MRPLKSRASEANLAWDIDYSSGHAHGPGQLSACFDFEPTASGAVRAVGPYGGADLSPTLVTRSITRLTETVESATGHYVVWGTLVNEPQFCEHQLRVLGVKKGFLPNLSMRETLLLSSPCDTGLLLRGWYRTPSGEYTHRCNGLAGAPDDSAVDLAVLHPVTAVEVLNLELRLMKPLVGTCLEVRVEKLSGWSPLLASTAKPND